MRTRSIVVTLAVVLIVLGTGDVTAQKKEPVERWTCFAANMSGMGRSSSGVIQMTIERWSTDEERDLLRTTFLQQGPSALLKALQSVKPRVGFMRLPNTMGWDLYYARETKNADGTRRVVLGTDRHVGFGEVVNNTRTLDYEFTLVEVHFDAEGKGEGKLAVAAKIDIDKKTNQVEVENYSARPIDLINVKVEKKKEKKEKEKS